MVWNSRESDNHNMRTVCLRVAAVVLMSVAPVIAALPEDTVKVCEYLRAEQLIYVGQAGIPFPHRPFEDAVNKAREAWLRAKSESDRFPQNVELLLTTLAAYDHFQHVDAMSPDDELTLTPMTVAEIFRGSPPAESFVTLRNDAVMEPGKAYLFFGDDMFAPFGLNIHGTHLPPKEATEAEDELQFLRASTTRAGTGVIYGALDLESASDREQLAALAGVSIRITAPGYVGRATTNENGIFIATDVAPGRLTLTPLLPDQFGVVNRSALNVNLENDGCVPINLRAALNGRVRGRVVGADGEPRPQLPMQLEMIESVWYRSNGTDARLRVMTDENGNFEFTAIPPGRYLLGHQISYESDFVTQEDRERQKTYYPGTSERSAAVPIVVGNATQHDGFNFTIR
jgi:hypothetical protein